MSARQNLSSSAQPAAKKPGRKGEISYRSFAIIALLVFLLLFLSRPVKNLLAQEQEIQHIKAQIATEQERQQQLKDLIAQWDDDEYVAAQARARLGYARPGETQYLVIDPAAKAKQLAKAEGQALEGPPRPWFRVMSDSLAAAGEVPAVTPETVIATSPESPATPSPSPEN
ncbi:hypothetical protein BM477_02480 [Boudabousia marimammalium]|uniref:Septum formation initiator n=2 Tax=Boudabousia marimammalium TaxID=156892 RepID=A0A1Q5PRQ7_9ACTO|nr:hypothetical protein BM477_02480 [Boudabousia marimammalium]